MSARARARRFRSGCRQLSLLLVWLLCIPVVVTAGRPHPFLDLDLQQFHHSSWSVRQGAPGQITALAQTADGHLWIGTQSGLFRFDGVSFERIVPAIPFPTEHVSTLYAAPDGSLWIGFRYGVVSHLDGIRVRHYQDSDGLPTGSVFGFATGPDGTLWAATWQGLARLLEQRWQVLDGSWGYPGRRAHAVLVDRSGTLWAASESGIASLPQGQQQFVAHPGPVTRVSQIAQAPDGSIWIAESDSGGGIRQLTADATEATASRYVVHAPTRAFLFDQHGSLWAATLGEGVARIARPTISAAPVQKLEPTSSLSAGYLRAVLQDREGNLWFGSNLGLERFRRSNAIPVAVPQGGHEFTVGVDAHGGAWIGSRNRPLAHLRDDQLRTGLGPGGITAALRDGERMLFGNPDGLWAAHGERVHKLAALPENLAQSGVQTLAVDATGAIWVSLNVPGLYHLRGNRWEHLFDAAFPQGATPLVVLSEPEDVLWMGFSRSRLVRRQAGSFDSYSTEQGLQVGNVTALARCGEGLCIGGERGLAIHDGRQVHMLAADNDTLRGITGMVSDRNGDLWVNGATGITRIRLQLLQQAARGQPLAALEHFDHLDGLASAPTQLRPLNSAVLADDGRVWFAETSSVVWIDPEQVLRNPLPPTLLIRGLNTESQRWLPTEHPLLPPSPGTVTIDYTATSLSIPERVRFRYRIEGVDSDWQDAGPRRQAIYTHLGPGEFRFQVIAANEDGVWNQHGASMSFSVAPHFHETHWFVLAWLGLALLALRVFLWLRLAQERARLRAGLRERHLERERIARELHDTLLQGYQGLILSFQAIGNRLTSGDPLRDAIDHALDRAENALIEGRDRVRNLRDQGEPEELWVELERIGQCYRDEPVVYRVTHEGRPHQLDHTVQDETLYMAREAISNAFRHAQASTITVALEYAPDHFGLCVRDDGCGLPQTSPSGHYGLLGLAERAAHIGAELSLDSTPQQGTQVVLRIPARIAYRDPPVATRRRWAFWRRH